MKRLVLVVTIVAFAFGVVGTLSPVSGADPPVPLLSQGHPVEWWFVFKFNAASFPGCGDSAQRQCPFGGKVQPYTSFGQQYVYASSENGTLQKGNGCVGAATDPVAATFEQIYSGAFHYVVWNDQFYNDPKVSGCGTSCSGPWGHSKGAVAWDDDGNGVVLQVSTPSWPAAGSAEAPRQTDGNTLGCVKDNNVKVSQHFFALKLTKADLLQVLAALRNASVVTVPENRQVVNKGGPADVQGAVGLLGKRSDSTSVLRQTLSTGVQLIAKPSALRVPPWQMVSALLDGVGIRAATWWATPKIYTTRATTKIACWDASLGKPGPVQIALTGEWDGTDLGLEGGPGPNFNHAKIGVSTTGTKPYTIFGDLNQQGTLSGTNCGSSQNGRGGVFYIVDNKTLFDSVTDLIAGNTAPTQPPRK